ncbi:MAG: sulfatase, partial [Verrucomicrobiota bacterium]
LFSTISNLVEEPPAGDLAGMDSFSMEALIFGGNEEVRPFSIHHSLNGTFAIRQGDWKLIDGRGSGGFTRPRTLDSQGVGGQLYHLGDDSQETTNRFGDQPGVVAELMETLAEIKQKGET